MFCAGAISTFEMVSIALDLRFSPTKSELACVSRLAADAIPPKFYANQTISLNNRRLLI